MVNPQSNTSLVSKEAVKIIMGVIDVKDGDVVGVTRESCNLPVALRDVPSHRRCSSDDPDPLSKANKLINN